MIEPASSKSSGWQPLSGAIGSLVVATAWLVSRVFVGLDLTDEMQYYGEIASLVRTGRFFHDDLFVQQLGYFFVYPFFKLHALLFLDHAYLVVFGRLLFLAAYLGVAVLFWRCATLAGGFPVLAKIAALAVFAAWIPFQLFAFAYNSWAYLLIVAVTAIWHARERLSFARYALSVSLLLAMLCVGYPPAGPVMIAVATLEVACRLGVRRAVVFLAYAVICGLVVLGSMVALHGADFFAELAVSLRFSRMWGTANAFLQGYQPLLLTAVLATCGLLLARLVKSAATAGAPASLSTPVMRFAAAGGVLILFASSVAWSTGYFGTVTFVAVVSLVAVLAPAIPDATPAKLAALGTLLGLLFAVIGGDGFHNFGVGAIGVVPALALHAARALQQDGARQLPAAWRAALLPAVTLLLVLNGALHPYREVRPWEGLRRVSTVPAFKGIWTAPVKVAAFDIFNQLSPHGAFRGKRILVAGPHAWLYFASGGEPSTPMIFMHFTSTQEAYDLIAERLFVRGMPEAIFATNRVPQIVADRLAEWSAHGRSIDAIALPPLFRQRFYQLVEYDFAPEAMLLTRPPAAP